MNINKQKSTLLLCKNTINKNHALLSLDEFSNLIPYSKYLNIFNWTGYNNEIVGFFYFQGAYYTLIDLNLFMNSDLTNNLMQTEKYNNYKIILNNEYQVGLLVNSVQLIDASEIQFGKNNICEYKNETCKLLNFFKIMAEINDKINQ